MCLVIYWAKKYTTSKRWNISFIFNLLWAYLCHYGIIRLTVLNEYLKPLVYKRIHLQKIFQLFHRHLHDLWSFLLVEPVGREGREFGSLIERRVAVEIYAAVRWPQVGRDGHPVDAVPTYHPARGGDPCDYVRCTAAVVVEATADGVLVALPVADVELAHLRDHVGEGVRGRLVVGVSLVLVGV